MKYTIITVHQLLQMNLLSLSHQIVRLLLLLGHHTPPVNLWKHTSMYLYLGSH
jgi:hypothetical protein